VVDVKAWLTLIAMNIESGMMPKIRPIPTLKPMIVRDRTIIAVKAK